MHAKIIDKALGCLLFCSALSMILCFPVKSLLCQAPDLAWIAIDVNSQNQQSDAHLIQIRGQANILIDTGHILYAADLLEFLGNLGVRRLDAVIISHGHNDHYGGLIPLLKSGIAIGAVYFNPPEHSMIKREYWGGSIEEIEEILHECALRDIPVSPMTNQTQWIFDNDISLRVIHIFDGTEKLAFPIDINDFSAVIMLTHGKMKYLFTGDINRAAGLYLTENSNRISLKADILKVPHHGAEGLPADGFFLAVEPEVMIVPAPAALWFSNRCARMRTLSRMTPAFVNGLHGHITVKSYGSGYDIETYKTAER